MQTTPQGFKYVEPADAITDFPAVDQSNWKLAEARTPRRVTSAQMTALTGLVDGQEIELEVDAAAGIYWRLRYRPSSPNAEKWEFVGGPELFATVLTAESAAASGSVFIDAATPGPSLTVPRAGVYDIRFGAGTYNASSANRCQMAPKLGAATTSASDAALAWLAAAGAGYAVTMGRTLRRTLAALDVVKLQYTADGSTQGWFFNRELWLRPVRVA